MERTIKEIVDAFRAAAKYKTAGQIARESDIKLTTAKRLKGKGYPKSLKGEVIEAVVAYTKAISDQTVPRETPEPADETRRKAAAYDLIAELVAFTSGVELPVEPGAASAAERAMRAKILRSLLDRTG